MEQIEIWAYVAQTALNYIFINTITSTNQKQTVTDLKTDLRTTKEDLLAEMKSEHQSTLREIGISTKAQIDILTSHIQAIEKENKGGSNNNAKNG